MKRIISLLFTLVFVLTTFSSLVLQVGAYSSNTSFGTAKSIDVNKSYTSNLSGYADEDWFKFTLTQAGKVSVSFTHDYVDSEDVLWYISLYDENKTKIGNLWSYVGETTKTETTCNHGLPAGTYYVMVESNGWNLYSTVDFDIKVNFTASESWEKEFNDNYYTSNPVIFNQTYYGTTMYYTDHDWYNFTLTKAEKINISFTHGFVDSESAYWSLAIYDDNNTRISDYYFYKGNVTNTVATGDIELNAGTYYIEIKSGGSAQTSSVDYSVSVNRGFLAPQLKSVVNTVSGVKVTWDSVTGADSYYVYRKSGSGSWKRIAIDVQTTYYIDETAKSGTSYKYTVRAKNESGLSGYNVNGLSIKYLATPDIVATANTTNGVTIKWNKVTGANGYVVYRKTTGKWVKIATVKGNSKVKYADKKVKSGTLYRYTVRAYYGSTLSSYEQNGVAVKRLLTPSLKSVTSTKSGITFKWNKVTGANGYLVYRKTGFGGWKKIATVRGNTKVSYLDKTARKGVSYKYTVRAYYGTSRSYYNTKGLTIRDRY